MTGKSWSERLLGGFRRTSERLGENLAGLTGKARLDEEDLDRIEEALRQEIPSVRVTIHVEPDDEAKLPIGTASVPFA